MEERIEKKIRSSSEKQGGSWLNSFCMATLAFLTVVLAHQFFLGLTSHLLGYETKVTFGKVVSMPFENKYWSNARVLFMYALPSAAYLLFAVFLAAWPLLVAQTVNRLYWFMFWCMVFSILFISAQFTLAPMASYISKGPIYQGISVAANWWGFNAPKLFGILILSLLFNVAFGILSFRLVMQLSPSRSGMSSKKNQRLVIRNYFIFPIVLVLPVAIILGYRDSIPFFIVMLLHSLLWLPGLLIKTQLGYHFEGKLAKPAQISTSYVLLLIVFISLIVIRIFL